MSSRCFSLALCFRDEPIALNDPPAERPLSHRVEDACRASNVSCLVDVLNLPPARSLKGLLRPVPRMQDVVTMVFPDTQRMREVLGAEEDPASLLGRIARAEHVLFWVPALSIPTLKDVEKRMAAVARHGSAGWVGTLLLPPVLPGAPPQTLSHPEAAAIAAHEARLSQDPRLAQLQYDRRVFRAVANTANGDVQPGLEFQYHEEDGQVWASYEGDGVQLGSLVATKDSTGRLRLSYSHLASDGSPRAGHCISYPEILPDSRLRIHEFWRWSSGDQSSGISMLEEREGVTIERKVS